MYKKTWIILIAILFIKIFFISDLWAIEVKRQVLKNGLTVIHYERTSLPLVKAVLLLDVSPLDEPSKLAGLSNLTGEMLIEGTKKRTSSQISYEIEFMGAGIGVSTSDDFTMASLFTLKKDFDHGFEILSDIVQNPIFPEKEFSRIKEILLGSLKQNEESPSYLASKAFLKEMFNDHSYGRLVTGNIDTIPNIKQNDLKLFHKNFYIPKRATLIVVGDISFEDTIKIVERNLSNWKNNENAEPKRSDLKITPHKKIVTIDRPLTQATIAIGILGIKRGNPDYYKLSVMNYILGGGGFTSRLMKTIRNDKGYAYNINSHFTSLKYGGYFNANVQTKNELSDKVIEETYNEIKKIKEVNVTERELSDAKAFLTGSFPLRLDTLSDIANFLALTEFYGLGMSYDKDYIGYINNVTIDDVKDVASRYLDDNNIILIIVGDLKKISLDKIH
jgi:zinc protease